MHNTAIPVMSILLLIGISSANAFAQEEIGLSTFQETAQIMVDRSISQNVTASITLQSTSIQEIKIPAELEQKIREDDRIQAIVFTNQNQCVLGVIDESCIMINVLRNPDDKGITAIQKSSRETGDMYIDEINQAFDTSAKFHSVFIHSDDRTNEALETSGVVSGKGKISIVYTLPMEDTASMYEKISAMLIPKIIRDGGGFYDVAKTMSNESNSKMTVSILPMDTKSLLQLKLSVDYPGEGKNISQVSPLDFLKVDSIDRTGYFSSGFYPLNSIIQVVILSPEATGISDIKGSIVPTKIIDNERIPTEITKEGWVFDPAEGKKIQGKYIFGKEMSVSKEKLKFSLETGSANTEEDDNPQPSPDEEPVSDESIIIVAIITIVAILAAMFYLKGYRR